MGTGATADTDLPFAGWHFLLLAGGDGQFADANALAAQLRRMGLAPEIGGDMPAALAGTTHPPTWQLRLGALRVRAGVVRSDAALLHDALTGLYPRCDEPQYALLVTPDTPAAEAARVGQSRELFKLACLLADAIDAQHFYWSPAQLWSDVSVFRRAIEEMLASGMPPVLHLVAFPQDAAGLLATRGLSFYCGQELAVVDSGGLQAADQLRRLARLAIDMMANGPIRGARRFPGMVAGEVIAVEPAAAGSLERLRIRIERP
jgi:hypothetical protein